MPGQFYSIPTAGGHTNPQAAYGLATGSGWGSALGSGSGSPQFMLVDPTGRQIYNLAIPANPIIADSGVQGNAQVVATLSGQSGSGLLAYIAGFQVFGAGATAAKIITITVSGLACGDLHFPMVVPAGATASLQYPANIVFPFPIPASGVGTNITVTVPAFGPGNTAACVVAEGFLL